MIMCRSLLYASKWLLVKEETKDGCLIDGREGGRELERERERACVACVCF